MYSTQSAYDEPIGLATQGTERAPGIHEEMKSLHERIVTLKEELNRLHGRLEPVMQPSAPAPNGANGQAPRPATSPLVSYLREMRDLTNDNIGLVRHTLDRLEL